MGIEAKNKTYSNVICIGDSVTNERYHYEFEGILDKFKSKNYVYKSYPELLGNYYGCPYETLGEPGMTIPFTILELIKHIDYILSLENPLVIFQFGNFFNATLKVDDNLDIMWKDLYSRFDGDDIVVDESSKFIDGLDSDEKLAIITWFSKYEEFRNYWYIEEFFKISKMLNRMKPIDIFGMLYGGVSFKIPTDYHLLNMWGVGPASHTDTIRTIDTIFPDIIDGHKTTESNKNLANEIIRQININKNSSSLNDNPYIWGT